MFKKILLATAISGALDILWAMFLTVSRGRDVGGMLRFVASGPVPPAVDWGVPGALLGLVVHFSLMAIMAAIFMIAWKNAAFVQTHPIWCGLGYGLISYAVLDLIVVPLRFAGAWPPSSASIATQLFAHLILVGLVFALVAGHCVQSAADDQTGRTRRVAGNL